MTKVTNRSSIWNRDPPPGFQGLREDLPLTRYARHLPHWRQPGATYFVTFRLADSLPKEKLHELDLLRSEWLKVGKVADTAPRFGEIRHHSLRLELESRWTHRQALARRVV
jgi:hypothetical protein